MLMGQEAASNTGIPLFNNLLNQNKMPISNLNNIHFSQAEMDAINKGWDEILTILNGKSRNLNPEERQKYGSVSEQNKLVIQKMLDYHRNQPHLDCPDVDYNETLQDWADRNFLAAFVAKMTEASNICNNIRITHDYDAYKAAQTDYDFAKYKMSTEPGAGWESKYDELLPFFRTNTGGGVKENTAAEPAQA